MILLHLFKTLQGGPKKGQGDISQVSLKACFFWANYPVGTKNIPTGQIAPKKYALRLTWEMSAWEMSLCPKKLR